MSGACGANHATRLDVTTAVEAELARVVRDHAGRLAASLVSLLGDFSAAEDLVSDAVLIALQHWPVEGVPAKPLPK